MPGASRDRPSPLGPRAGGGGSTLLVVRSLPLAPHSRPGNSEDRAVRDPLYPPTPNQVTEGEVRCSIR